MSLDYRKIGQNIKAKRMKRGYSQAQLAELIDKSPTCISYIETAYKCVSLETLVDIANALNTTADELLDENLQNTVYISNHIFSELVSDCSDYEKKVITDILTSAKKSLRENKWRVDYYYKPVFFVKGQTGGT